MSKHTTLEQLTKLAVRTKSEIDGVSTRITAIENAGYVPEADVDAKINSKIGSAYKPGGTKSASQIAAGDLNVEANHGKVYNLSDKLTLTSSTKSLFVEGAENSYPAGTNIVVVETTAPVYAAASGTAQSGTTYYERHGSVGAYEYSVAEVETDESVSGLYTRTSEGTYKFDALSGFVDLSGYAEKVTSATNGNFAALDSNGNLTDSGHKHSDYLTSHQDITGKADKVTSATNGNFAALDSNGNLTDSGHKHSDYLTSHQDITGKADLSVVADTYDSTKTYAVGDLCIYSGGLYRCSTDISTAETWTSGHWTSTDIDSELISRIVGTIATDSEVDDMLDDVFGSSED